MNTFFPRIVIVATAVLGAASFAQPDGAAFSCINAKGEAILTNHPSGNRCEKVVSGTYGGSARNDTPAPVPLGGAPAPAHTAPQPQQAAADSKVVAAAPADPQHPLVAPSSVARQPRNAMETRLAMHREAMIQQTADAYAAGQQAPGANRAVSRRYLMTNRAAYQQVVGVTP